MEFGDSNTRQTLPAGLQNHRCCMAYDGTTGHFGSRQALVVLAMVLDSLCGKSKLGSGGNPPVVCR
jgi:hypothetical protein